MRAYDPETDMELPTDALMGYQTVRHGYIARLFVIRTPRERGFRFMYINTNERMANNTYDTIREACDRVFRHRDNTHLKIFIFESETEFFEWAADLMAEREDRYEKEKVEERNTPPSGVVSLKQRLYDKGRAGREAWAQICRRSPSVNLVTTSWASIVQRYR